MNIKKMMFLTIILLLAILAVYYVYPTQKIGDNVVIDSISVLKSKHELIAFSKGKSIVAYSVSLGSGGKGPKVVEGDGKTPEGEYFIVSKNSHSKYHLNLGISYPNSNDKKNANRIGKPPGADIKIHGLKNGLGYIGKFQRWKDWTNGCIGLTNSEIEELFNHTKIGAPISIVR